MIMCVFINCLCVPFFHNSDRCHWNIFGIVPVREFEGKDLRKFYQLELAVVSRLGWIELLRCCLWILWSNLVAKPCEMIHDCCRCYLVAGESGDLIDESQMCLEMHCDLLADSCCFQNHVLYGQRDFANFHCLKLWFSLSDAIASQLVWMLFEHLKQRLIFGSD